MKGYLLGNAKRGIYRIYNLKTDRTYLNKAEDMAASEANERFQLDLGMHSNKALQDDYAATGLELFVFDTYKEADKEADLEELLLASYEELKDKGIPIYE